MPQEWAWIGSKLVRFYRTLLNQETGLWPLQIESKQTLFYVPWTVKDRTHGPALTHWNRVTHICVSKLTTIGSDNGLSPGRRQAIIWSNAGILLIWTLIRNKYQWNLKRNWCIFIQANAFENVVWKMAAILSRPQCVNTLRPRQNGRHFSDDIFEWIFWNENVLISINISLKFVPGGPINNIPTLLQIVALRRPSDKPLSEPMTVRLTTHICVTRPQWVKKWLCLSGHRVALVVHRAQKSVPDSAGEWPTFLPPPLESCSGTVNVDSPNCHHPLANSYLNTYNSHKAHASIIIQEKWIVYTMSVWCGGNPKIHVTCSNVTRHYM